MKPYNRFAIAVRCAILLASCFRQPLEIVAPAADDAATAVIATASLYDSVTDNKQVAAQRSREPSNRQLPKKGSYR